MAAGLWPFHAPENGVAWLRDANGIAFNYGTVLSPGDLSLSNPEHPASYSLEIWLEPALSTGWNTFLTIYRPRNPLQFSLHQSNSDLAIDYQASGGQHRTRAYVDNVLQQDQAVFITLASGAEGLTVYLNGVPARRFPGFLPAGDGLAGRLVIGTSPTQEDCWFGRLRGLALYRTELTPKRIFEHYRTWTQSGQPTLAQDDKSAALYLFNEHSGNVFHNRIGSGGNLYVPERFMVLHEKFLELPWKEYYSGLGYWKDIAINIGGFVPLGFSFCAYWALSYPIKRAAFAAVLVGVAVTLTIEILQSYLPTRQSGVTDLFTNTAGTWLGALLYCWPPLRNLLTGTLDRLTAARADP